jgi:hypothetical protein
MNAETLQRQADVIMRESREIVQWGVRSLLWDNRQPGSQDGRSLEFSWVLSQTSAVGIATCYGLDDRGVRFRVPVGSGIFSSPQRQPPIQWVPGARRPGMNLTTNFQLELRTMKSWSIRPLRHTYTRCSASLVKHEIKFNLLWDGSGKSRQLRTS